MKVVVTVLASVAVAVVVHGGDAAAKAAGRAQKNGGYRELR